MCSIVVYFILTAVTQLLTFAFMFAFNIAPGTTNYALMTEGDATQYLLTAFRISAIMAVLQAIAGYIGVHYIMHKKVNLS